MPEKRLMSESLERSLSKLPFEEGVSRLLDRAQVKIDQSAPMKAAASIHERLPELPQVSVPTPFGSVRLPNIKPPSPRPPVIDERRRKATKMAVLSDISFVVGFVPVVGDIVADIVSDTATYELRQILTPDEFTEYVRQDRFGPSTVAVMQAFIKKR